MTHNKLAPWPPTSQIRPWLAQRRAVKPTDVRCRRDFWSSERAAAAGVSGSSTTMDGVDDLRPNSRGSVKDDDDWSRVDLD